MAVIQVLGLALTSLLLLGAAPVQEKASSDALPTSHARMLALLEQIRAESAKSNSYLGSDIVEELRRALAGVPKGAKDVRVFRAYLRQGTELLRIGRTEDSIASYAKAVEVYEAIPSQVPQAEAAEALFLAGTAHMRQAENQNCCLKNNADSCILPIQGGGRHQDETGSRAAIAWFLRALAMAPEGSDTAIKARWLLNVAHMTLGSWPDGVPEAWRIDPKTFASDEPFPRFVDVAPEVGLSLSSLAGGLVVEDFDQDGLLDVLTSTSDTGGEMRYYRNDASGRLVDRSAEANLAGLFGGLNLASGDYDNDGDVDVLVLRGAWWQGFGRHPKSLLQNDGHGVFTDVTFDAGLGASRFPTQNAGFCDYDNDGDLDLYIGNESEASTVAPCELYRNDGHGRFEDVAAQAGVTNDRYTKSCAFGDYDGDRYPDLYVANMAGPNRLYHNDGDGTFTDVAEKLGVGLPFSAFPSWFFDFDQDGALDLWVSGFGGPDRAPNVADVAASYLHLPHQGEMMRLYKGDGRGGFADVAAAMGLDLYTLPMGSNFGDLDNDGYPDLYLGTGYPYYEGLIPNVMYHNRRGKGFADVTTAGGFGNLQKGHAVVFADLDNDGDQDVIEKMGGAYPGDAYRPLLYENPGFGAHWIKVRLVGVRSNRFGVGARMRLDVVEDGKPRSIHKTVGTGGSFGANPLRQEIGLGSARRIERLEVFWPRTGERQVLTGIDADQAIVVQEGETGYEKTALRTFELGG